MKKRLCTLALTLVAAVHALAAAAPGVEQMTANARTNPLGIASANVSLGWAMTAGEERGAVQTACQVRVGTTEGGKETWDSGRIVSDRQADVAIPADVRLAPATRYFWQVKIWDGKGAESPWSASAWFETGLLSKEDWAGSEWITRSSVRDDAGWTDYVAEIDFSLQKEAFGVFLRASPDAQNGYMEQINVTGSQPLFKPHKKVNGVYTETARIDLSKFGFSNADLLQGRHTLVFEVRGSTVTTVLDGKKIDTRADTTFPGGRAGFRTSGGESATVYRAKVADAASRASLMAPDFGRGESGLSGGTVAGGVYRISGGTEAVFTGEDGSLPLLRGVFRPRGEVRSARIYASAHGLYELWLNGKKVGDQFLAPGWTDYPQRTQSQTYDVTALVQKGENVLGAALADGWYRGKVGLNWTRVYGDTLALVAKVKLTCADGSVEWFATNGKWLAAAGPLVRADLQDGEIFDAGRVPPGWSVPGFDASAWKPVSVTSGDSSKLVPQPDEPVRATQVLNARTRTAAASGGFVYDLGQNMVGVARVKMTGKKGQTARIRYAEEVYRQGERKGALYTENFRTAKVTDTYVFGADGIVTYQPAFTQHGFRYVEVSGLSTPPEVDGVQGVVLGSDLPDTGDLRLSNPLLDQLVRNVRWGQRSNFLSIPTDTPARDERLGWTGDIGLFAPTAARYRDTRAFLSKWMDDVRDAQRPNGNIPAVVPQPRREFDATGVGWSDAVITVPYAVWRATGDTRIVRENREAMRRFYGFVRESATRDGNLLEEGRSSWFSGDWLNLEKVNRLDEHRVIATAYFSEDTRMMAEMAAAVGEDKQAAEWAALVPEIRKAFSAAYRQPDGSIYTGTQTVYAMALGMDLIADPAQRAQTAAKFIEKLSADNYHLRTGFLGTPWLLPALTGIGRDDLAMRLLLNEDYPSWGFEIRMGATTMWERWNTIRADGEFGDVQMNSFNHYAYGAVADWMFQHLGGLQIVEAGYKKSRVAPLVGAGGLTSSQCSLRTPYGLLGCEWKQLGGVLTLVATIPASTTAEIVVPARSGEAVREGGGPASAAPGVKSAAYQPGRLVLQAGSGRYEFTVR